MDQELGRLTFSVNIKYAYKIMSDGETQRNVRRTFEGRYRQQQN
jgi:hypothetical protein